MRRLAGVLIWTLGVSLMANRASAGTLLGFLYDPFGYTLNELSVATNQTGDLGGYGQNSSSSSPPSGLYTFSGLPSGTYSVGLNEKNEWKRKLGFGVSVGSGTTMQSFSYSDPNFPGGIEFGGWPQPEFAQSFVATGTSVIGVSVRLGAVRYARACIRDTDPYGAQIGPERVVSAGYGSGTAAHWSAGEVPTVPGHIYCVVIREYVPGGIQQFYCKVRELGGNYFPEGKCWINGAEVATQLATVIGQDDDGISTTVSTSKLGDQVTHQWANSSVGQTFVATGTSVLCCGVLFGTGATFIASVHDGVGGPQIGPAKYVTGVAWNARSMAVWSPGEVPTVPGHTYYMAIRRADNAAFTIYRLTTSEYGNGTAYVDGAGQSYDLSITIASEASPGSATASSQVSVSTPTVSARSSHTATITWTSYPNGDESYVEYGPGTPYTFSATGTSVGATHSVALTGLDSNTLYHYRVITGAAGYRTATSRDLVFVTDPVGPNLVSDPGFESGLASWTLMPAGDLNVRNYPPGGPSAWFGGLKAHSGNWFLGGASNGGQIIGGAYQRVAVKPGDRLNLRAWLRTYQTDHLGDWKDSIVWGRVGVDLAGGTDPSSGAVLWSAYSTTQDWYNSSHPSIWIESALSFIPAGTVVTVFLQAGCDSEIEWTVFGWDDVVLAQSGPCDKPFIARQPVSQFVCSGDGFSLSVGASGDPPLYYHWRRNESDISGATAETYSVSASDPAVSGSYTCLVTNACGTATSAAATVTVAQCPTTIPEGKLLPNSSVLALKSKAVTAAFAGSFYLEEPDRSGGILVVGSGDGLLAGARADAEGTMNTNSDGERYLHAWSVAQSGNGAVSPLVLITRDLGGMDWHYDPGNGAGQAGLPAAIGLNNIGLLVTLAGRVTAVGEGHFYVDDGSALADGSGNVGVKVSAEGLDLPGEGETVRVTGISSIFRTGGVTYRQLLATSLLRL